uniref:Uncharacterized protein n=1 Tax=Chenopodium quinoa TaxID=63459 RepID=A0A803KRE7_CHEQI
MISTISSRSRELGNTLIISIPRRWVCLTHQRTFYEQNGTIQGILSGDNYGSAQATILPFANIPTFQSLNQQQRQAFETIQLLQLQLGEQEAHQFISSSIFYLSAWWVVGFGEARGACCGRGWHGATTWRWLVTKLQLMYGGTCTILLRLSTLCWPTPPGPVSHWVICAIP